MSGQERFFEAYLVAYVFWIGVVLGSLALLMVQHLSGGAWGVVIRRPLEAAARTMPVMAVLFVPIVLGMGHLYHWTHPEALPAIPIIRDEGAYLNTPFFIARQVFYFAVWSVMAMLLTRWSAEQDRTGDPALLHEVLGAVGRRARSSTALTVTFAMSTGRCRSTRTGSRRCGGCSTSSGQGLSALRLRDRDPGDAARRRRRSTASSRRITCTTSASCCSPS